MKLKLAMTLVAIGIGLSADVATAWQTVLISSNRDGNAEIYLVDLGENTAKNLTDNRAEDTFPAWSPQGRQIAFVSSRSAGGIFNVFVMDADGKNVQQLTNNPGKYTYNPVWSPDGKQILYNVRDNQGIVAMLMDADGSNARRLAENVWDPVWSPDGKKIAFTRLTDAGFKIYIMDADGANPQDLGTNNNRQGWSYPAWSGDGTKLLFGDLTDNNSVELFVADVDGRNRARLTRAGGRNSFAAWSPDGKRIMFRQFNVGAANWPCFWIDLDGRNLQIVEALRNEPPLNNNLDPGRVAFKPQ